MSHVPELSENEAMFNQGDAKVTVGIVRTFTSDCIGLGVT